jgi:hypothetical protein
MYCLQHEDIAISPFFAFYHFTGVWRNQPGPLKKDTAGRSGIR